MGTPVIVGYVRTPFGKRHGWLSSVHPTELLATTFTGLFTKTGVPADLVDLVIGGCVTQVGEQSSNITRLAWLHAGLPTVTGASTLDNQCGSAQQAAGLLASHIQAGVIQCGIACGVESMSRAPLGSGGDTGSPYPDTWTVDLPHQLIAADRIAQHRKLTRADLDEYAARSQRRAAAAWAAKFYADHVLPVRLPEPWQQIDRTGAPVGPPITEVTTDQGLRATDASQLGALKPALPDGLHTAGNSSQISDGACALLLMDANLAAAHGVPALARISAQTLCGTDPHYHLDGTIDATKKLLTQTNRTITDFSVIEVNEAFASVALSWAQVFDPEQDRFNPHGGAIALGHPVGVTGIRLLGQAIKSLHDTDGESALVTMCCGGAQATGMIVDRI